MSGKTWTVEEWRAVQSYYDEGNSWDEVAHQFNISKTALLHARKRGDLKGKTAKEAMKSIKTRQKISKNLSSYYRQNPTKSPYILSHRSKGPSYPEQYFADVFKKEGVLLDRYVRVGSYELDFADDILQIDVEIDGNQHYSDPRVVESDKRRTAYLETNGWTIFRIRWSRYTRYSEDDKHNVILQIKQLIEAKRASLPIDIAIMPMTGQIRDNSKYCRCGKKICRQSSACVKCSSQNRTGTCANLPWPSKEELEKLVWMVPLSTIAKQLGVSHGTVSKKCDDFGIQRPKWGYWAGKVPAKPPTQTQAVLDGRKRMGEKARKRGPEGTSWCRLCKQFVPIENFTKNKSKWNGLSKECKLCRSKYRSPKKHRE